MSWFVYLLLEFDMLGELKEFEYVFNGMFVWLNELFMWLS